MDTAGSQNWQLLAVKLVPTEAASQTDPKLPA